MTPTSIRTGRALDATTSSFTIATGLTTDVLTGDANRVGLVVSVGALLLAAFDGTIVIRGGNDGAGVPLTVLTPGHPVCYLSVDKIGSVIYGAISVQNNCTGSVTVGVTEARVTGALDKV